MCFPESLSEGAGLGWEGRSSLGEQERWCLLEKEKQPFCPGSLAPGCGRQGDRPMHLDAVYPAQQSVRLETRGSTENF